MLSQTTKHNVKIVIAGFSFTGGIVIVAIGLVQLSIKHQTAFLILMGSLFVFFLVLFSLAIGAVMVGEPKEKW